MLNGVQKFVCQKSWTKSSNKNHHIILHHDNASFHTAHETIDYLKDKNIELISHCPHSSDLKHEDFSCSFMSNKKCTGSDFLSLQEAVDAFQNHIFELSTSKWKNCFKNWFEWMEQCINLKSEYFEKQ